MIKQRATGFQFHEIKLADREGALPSGIEEVQLLRIGKFNHRIFGPFEISTDTLRKLKENFDNNVRRIDIAFDYFHEAEKVAAGWFKEVILKPMQLSNGEYIEDGELWVRVDWTKTGRQKIQEKELRYTSADLDFAYEDEETGAKFGPTLLGAGLTNRPHIKSMQAVLSESLTPEQNEKFKAILSDHNDMSGLSDSVDKIVSVIMSLSEDEKMQIIEALGAVPKEEVNMDLKEKIQNLETKLSEQSNEIKDLKTKNVELSSENKKLKSENQFNVMLSEGTVVEAQRKPFLENNMAEFVKAGVKVNLDEKGGTEGTGGQEKKTVTRDEAVAQLHDIAEKKEVEKKISYGAALSEAMDENKELAEIANGK